MGSNQFNIFNTQKLMRSWLIQDL